MLFSPVYTESHPCRSKPFVSRTNLRGAAFASRPDVWALGGNRRRFPVPEMNLRAAASASKPQIPAIHPFYFHMFRKYSSSNFFILITIHFHGGCIPPQRNV